MSAWPPRSARPPLLGVACVRLAAIAVGAAAEFTALSPDPAALRWLNEAKAGGTSCGFLVVPLGPEGDGEPYPDVQVYVCMRFAATQPAPKGTIFGHAGGPWTLSKEGLEVNEFAGPDYNHLSIDQRGLGRSRPSFAVPECLSGGDASETEYTTEEGITAALHVVERTMAKCYQAPQFQLKATGGASQTYNFLQYSGTMALARDLDRFRRAIGAEKLSLHGASYGALAVATYATIFPEHVDKLVMNSPMSPLPDLETLAFDAAAGKQLVWDWLATACDDLGDECPVKAPGVEAVMLNVTAKLRSLGNMGSRSVLSVWHDATFGAWQKVKIALIVPGLHSVQRLYEAVKAGDDAAFLKLIEEAVAMRVVDPVREKLLASTMRWLNAAGVVVGHPPSEPDPDTWSAPTTPTFVAGIPQYTKAIGNTMILPQTLVLSQTFAGLPLSESGFLAAWRRARDTYPCLGLQHCLEDFAFWYLYGYKFPKSTPIPPPRNLAQRGVIVGFLYDPETPYRWAQEMQQRFPSTHLVSVQMNMHCLNPAWSQVVPSQKQLVQDCFAVVRRYLDKDELPEDGTVCAAPFFPVTQEERAREDSHPFSAKYLLVQQ